MEISQIRFIRVPISHNPTKTYNIRPKTHNLQQNTHTPRQQTTDNRQQRTENLQLPPPKHGNYVTTIPNKPSKIALSIFFSIKKKIST